MKLKTKVTVGILISLAVSQIAVSPAWSASRSHTVNVSCEIVPQIQISSIIQASEKPELSLSGKEQSIQIETNLAGRYKVSEGLRSRSEGLVKIFSVTAL